MRLAICSIALVLASTGLVACGQSGQLQLANSPDADHRAKYLLYSKDESKAVQTEEKQGENKDKDQVIKPDQSIPASQAN